MRKVMVIDDDPTIVEIVGEALGFAGYEVVGETSSAVVTDRVREESPDVILLDLMMPALDGWQLLEILQSQPETSEIPIVILTAATHSLPDIQSFYGSAVKGYLTKPFDIDDLVARVDGALSSPSSRSHAPS